MKPWILRKLKWTGRLIFENIGWKLVSLAAATTIWALVATEPELSTFTTSQVEYKSLPDDVELSSSPLTTVLLELRGPSGALNNISEPGFQPHVLLDMSDAAPGQRTFAIENGVVKLPRGVRLVRAIPSQVHFDFEQRGTAIVPVAIHVIGSIRPGYAIVSQHVQPARLTIVGPAGHVAKVGEAIADVDISQATETSGRRVNAILEDPYVRFQGSPQVEVTIAIRKQ